MINYLITLKDSPDKTKQTTQKWHFTIVASDTNEAKELAKILASHMNASLTSVFEIKNS